MSGKSRDAGRMDWPIGPGAGHPHRILTQGASAMPRIAHQRHAAGEYDEPWTVSIRANGRSRKHSHISAADDCWKNNYQSAMVVPTIAMIKKSIRQSLHRPESVGRRYRLC
jgi:hypothetical protein